LSPSINFFADTSNIPFEANAADYTYDINLETGDLVWSKIDGAEYFGTATLVPVPEPRSLYLLAAPLCGLVVTRKRRASP